MKSMIPKKLFDFALLLLLSAFVFLILQSLHKNRLELDFEAPTEGSLQIYYPVAGGYSEVASDRREYPAGREVRTVFLHEQDSLETLRLDPFDGPHKIVLRRILMSTFLFAGGVSSDALAARLQPAQMLDVLKEKEGGLVLQGNGMDPIAVLHLSNIPRDLRYKNMIIWVGLSLMAYLVVRKSIASVRGAATSAWIAVAFALFFSFGFLYLFYPGYMSYDSLHALRSARAGVTDAMWPPMVSYLWRLVDVVSPDPAAMFFVQVFLFLGCFTLLGYFLTRRLWWCLGILLFFCAVPVLLGTVAAIWKDVLMAGLLLAAMLAAFQVRAASNSAAAQGFFFLSIIFMWLAASARHNAITAVVPIAVYAGWAVVRRAGGSNVKRDVAASGLVAVLVLGGVYAGKSVMDRYSLPEFRAIAGTTKLMAGVRGMDLFGASLCLNRNLLESHSPRLSLDDIARHYDPRHVNLSGNVFSKVDGLGSAEFDRIWWQTLKDNPVCFFNNKLLLTKYLLGANAQQQFIIFAPSVDLNEFGYFLAPSVLRSNVERYILKASKLFFFRPWFFFLLSFPAVIYLARKSAQPLPPMVLFSSSMLYSAGLFLFGNAADARLLFYSSALNLLLVGVALLTWFSRSRCVPSGAIRHE